MGPDPATVLIVDDERLNIDLLEQELGAAGYRTLSADGGRAALALAARTPPDLILLDVMMRDLDGFETCRQLKASDATRSIPVIFLTALHDTFEKVRGFRTGAVDYVTKPFESEELLARVGVHIALRREQEAHGRSRAAIRQLMDGAGEACEGIVGTSAALQGVRDRIAQVAPTDSTVLIQGETGTGKELVARAIHGGSARRERQLIKINCAALPRELIESELFGHEKGAFTGATQQRRGRFELADGGSLFLDEVGELSPEAQAKLLRALQEREFERVGGSRSLSVDVRVIAATNRDLQREVHAGRFRSDLFYRLNVFPVILPPLRERRDDIAPLLQHLVPRIARRLGRSIDGVAPQFVERALRYDWPGNVRELENVLERALIMSRGGLLDDRSFGAAAAVDAAGDAASLEELERAHIRQVLENAGWRIEGDAGAARRLGLNPSTLRGRMRKLGIRRTG